MCILYLTKRGRVAGAGVFLVKYFGCAFEVGFLSSFSRLCLCRESRDAGLLAHELSAGGLNPTALLTSS